MFGVRRGAHVDPLYMGDNTAAAFRAIGYWDPQYPVHVYRNHPIFSNKCNETEQVFNKFNEIVRRHKKTVVLANASWLMLIGGFILFIYIQVDHSIWEMMGYNVLAYILVPMVAMFGGPALCFFFQIYARNGFRIMVSEMRNYANCLDGKYGDLKFSVTPNGMGPWRTPMMNTTPINFGRSGVSGANFPRIVVIASSVVANQGNDVPLNHIPSIMEQATPVSTISTRTAIATPIHQTSPVVATVVPITSPVVPTISSNSPIGSSSSSSNGIVSQLQQLADMHQSGALSDSEYKLAKSKVFTEMSSTNTSRPNTFL